MSSRLLEVLRALVQLDAALDPEGPFPGGGIAGLDWRVCPVDATGVALGTAGNPVATTPGTSPSNQPVVGTLTNNNAAPAATNVGALTGIANAAVPTWVEGDQVLVSMDLKGNQRVLAGGFAPAAPTATFTRGANTTPYTIGDEVGTAGTAPTAVSVGRYNGASGVIQGATLVYSSYPALVPALTVLLFSATVTLAGDNLQLNLSDGDANLLIGIIPLTVSQSGQYSAGAAVAAGNQILMGVPTCPIHFVCGGATTNIFAALITTNAYTPIANSEVAQLTLQVEQN